MACEGSQRGILTVGMSAVILGLETLVMLLVDLRMGNRGRWGGNVNFSTTKAMLVGNWLAFK